MYSKLFAFGRVSQLLFTLLLALPLPSFAGSSLTYQGSKDPVCAQKQAQLDLAVSGKASSLSGFFVTWYRNGQKFFEQNIGCKNAPSCHSGYSATKPGTYKAVVTYSYLYILTGQTITEQAPSNPIVVDLSPTGKAHSDFLLNGSAQKEVQTCFNQPIVMDGDSSSCYDGLFVSVQRSDQWWNRYGNEAMGWLPKSAWPSIGNFNVGAFAAQNGTTLQPGQYYRIKLAVGEPWHEESRLVFLRQPRAQFALQGSSQSTINLPSSSPLILNGSSSECADEYFVSVQESDANWNRFGKEYMRWLTPSENASISSLDLRKFASELGGTFTPGKYYRIKLATAEPWHEEVKLLYLQP